MKICWLLGVLTVALCEDVIQNSTVNIEANITTARPDTSPGSNKTLAKRQIVQLKEAQEKDNGRDTNSNVLQSSYWLPTEKRERFSSWAGKRDSDDSKENKRAKFSSWAGKRTPEENIDPPQYSKRTKFSSWAGKRDPLFDLDYKRKLLAQTLAGYSQDPSGEMDEVEGIDEEKRKFSSWGGKRGDASYENKRKFSSWSGKRNGLNTSPISAHWYLTSSPSYWLHTPNINADNNEPSEYEIEKTESMSPKYEGNILNDKQARMIVKGLLELNNAVDDPEYWSYSNDNMNEDKRSRFSNWGGKRKFSSWGGKRADEDFDFSDRISDIEKKAKFSSWAGKRDAERYWKSKYPGKRGKFSSWAGKRSDASLNELLDQEKRTKFSSWGGKRGTDDLSDINEDKRTKFSSWGGKRGIDDLPDINEDKRTKFSSWGGKRGFDGLTDIDEDKRTKFSSWGGKRGFDGITDIDEDKRTKFSSWGGKRGIDDQSDINEGKRTKFSSWGGKRGIDDLPDINEDKRTKFSSWGGKRGFDGITDIDEDKRTKFSSWGGKRGIDDQSDINEDKRTKFSSWGGKRGFDGLTDIEEDKRTKFSNWGGKRSFDYPSDINEDKRTRFSSWAGKRFDNEIEFGKGKRDTYLSDPKKKIKGRGFSSWGGKRSNQENDVSLDFSEEIPRYDSNNYQIKRANKFSSWAGKRNVEGREDKRKFSSWGGKRNFFIMEDEPTDTKLINWEGKRSVNPNDGPELDKRKEALKSGLLRRYNRFNSWRGKKDNSEPLNNTRTRLDDVDFNQSGDPTIVNKSKRGFSNYFGQYDLIKRNSLLRAWIGKHYPDMMAWKRRPAFSSWGGKRSVISEAAEDTTRLDEDIDEDKHSGSFNSEGNRWHTYEKRSIHTTTAEHIHPELNPSKKNFLTVRSLGARSALGTQRFYLRSSKDSLVAPAIRSMRRQFYAWGGKRTPKS